MLRTMFSTVVFLTATAAAAAPPAPNEATSNGSENQIKVLPTPMVSAPTKPLESMVGADCEPMEASPEELFHMHSWIFPIEKPTNPRIEWTKGRSSLYFNCLPGTSVRAIADGKVIYAGWYGGYGKVIILSHGSEVATLYAHMSKTQVAVSEQVLQGQTIGLSGNTGFCNGSGDLHLEIRKNGKPTRKI